LALALVGVTFAGIGELIALVGTPVASVGASLTVLGQLLAVLAPIGLGSVVVLMPACGHADMVPRQRSLVGSPT
jgi:hypothetical protein